MTATTEILDLTRAPGMPSPDDVKAAKRLLHAVSEDSHNATSHYRSMFMAFLNVQKSLDSPDMLQAACRDFEDSLGSNARELTAKRSR